MKPLLCTLNRSFSGHSTTLDLSQQLWHRVTFEDLLLFPKVKGGGCLRPSLALLITGWPHPSEAQFMKAQGSAHYQLS